LFISCSWQKYYVLSRLQKYKNHRNNQLISCLILPFIIKNVEIIWRPTLSIDELTGIPTFSLDLKPNEGKESLRRIFEYLKQSDKRCYIAIDEFQQILNYPENSVEAMIRSYRVPW